MTKNAKRIFEFLQGNGKNVRFTPKEVQNALGFERVSPIVGTVSGLVKKGFAAWDKEERIINGEKTIVSCFYLTQMGEDYKEEN